MKIVITVLGSRGDVQSLVALGVALRRAGHVVCLATDPACRPMIEARSLLFAPVGRDVRALLAGEQGTPFEHGRNPLMLALGICRMSGRLGRRWGQEVAVALEGADALIAGGAGGWVGAAAGERLGIPVLGAGLQPLVSTRRFPSTFLIAATDTAMRRRGADLGSRDHAEDGTDRAVWIIASLLKERPGSRTASLPGARLAGVAPS